MGGWGRWICGVAFGVVLMVGGLFACGAGMRAGAQGFGEFRGLDSPPDRRKPSLVPAAADPRYPLSAQMMGGRTRYVGQHSYRGRGLLAVDGRSFAFRSYCAYGFRIGHLTYGARWIKPDKKLEILMAKRGKTERCTLTMETGP